MIFNSELFTEDIINKRYEKHLSSMAKCAEQIGVSKATLSRIERHKLPDIGSLIRILKWLELPLERYIL